MSESDAWPEDYFASRRQFISLAQAGGAHTESHSTDAIGPKGEALTVDIAAFTSRHDEHRIILISGVHGIEGFIGARIQIQALRRLAHNGLPARIGVVMIHAVNPWGFSHLRRVDENNVDVNRNFIKSSPSNPVSHPYYAELDPVINPKNAPTASGEFKYWMQAGKLIARNRGVANLFKPIAEGQYDFAQGVFFGGAHDGRSCQLLQDLVLRHSAGIKRITLLDVHSGLGPSGIATLIGNSNIVTPETRLNWLHTQYDSQPVYVDSSSSNLYNAQGTFSQWCGHALQDKRFLYLCIEIGTVNPIRLFSALRRENQAHHWTDSRSKSYWQTKQALLDVFAPRSQRWRRKATAQGLHVLERTIYLSE